MSLTGASIYCLHLKMTRYTNFLSLRYDDLNRSVTCMRNNMFVILIIMMIVTLSGTNVSFGRCMFVILSVLYVFLNFIIPDYDTYKFTRYKNSSLENFEHVVAWVDD